MSNVTRAEHDPESTAGTHDKRPGATSTQPAIREYRFGQFRVDVALCQLWRDHEVIPLTPKAFDTLLVLLQRREELVSKEKLMNAVWPDSFVSEDTLTQNIWAIRRALGDDSSKQQFIATIPKRGYRFTAAVVEHLNETAASDAEKRDHPAPPETGESHVPAEQPAADSVPTLETAAPPLASDPIAVTPVPSRRARQVRWFAASALIAAGLGWLILAPPRLESAASLPSGVIRFTQDAPRGTVLISGGVLSPDGRKLAFVAQDLTSGVSRVWVRGLEAAEPQPVATTEGASRPFWSPDSRFLGFFEGGRLKRVSVSGDQPRVITSTVGVRAPGASWSSAGQIVFATSNRSGLYAVSASGGDARAVTTLDTEGQEIAHRWPHFLPDGRRFLFAVFSGQPDRAGIYVGSLDSPQRSRIVDQAAAVVYTPSGHLVYVKGGLLLAQPFDVNKAQVTGDPFPIAGDAEGPGIFTDNALSASNDGLITYGGGSNADSLVWLDRGGREVERLDIQVHNLSYSPDGQVLGSGAAVDFAGGVWLIDQSPRLPTRIVPEGSAASWSPDGRRIVYSAERVVGRQGLYLRDLSAGSQDVTLFESSSSIFLNDWSRDGKYVVFVSRTDATRQDIWLLPMSGDRKPISYLQTSANEIQIKVSPNGRYAAYSSDESGTWEVYVDTFPVGSMKRRLSLRGGAQPQWTASGNELFYIAPDHTLVTVAMADGRPRGGPTTLFRAPTVGALSNYQNQYAVSPDGERFVFEAGSYQTISVLFNWLSGAGGSS